MGNLSVLCLNKQEVSISLVARVRTVCFDTILVCQALKKKVFLFF